MVTLTSNPWPSPAEYEFIRQLVYTHSRIHLGADKKEMMGQRLQRRLKAIGLDSYQEYCDLLKSPEGEEELTGLIDVISTNVTSFFREEQHFEFLAKTVLPQWAADQNRRAGDVFRLWSAGCSSGEEPYSAAIVLADFFAHHPRFSAQVIASDISSHELQRAREGTYRIELVKLPEEEWLKRFFLKGVGAYQGSCRVKDDIKKLVQFYHANLFQPESPGAEPVDVIFCRNVMIYFDRETQEDLVQRFIRRLTPGGYLLVGHSESLLGVAHPFTTVRPSVHRLPASTAREAAPCLACA
jgi:chemotaxis protein methyltransferase CheR